MPSRRIDAAAAISAAVFVVVLAVAAYWDRGIRVLHVFESFPYVLAAALCLRGRKLGYALGVVSGAFWLWTAGFLTTFIWNGFERLEMLVRTGSVDRADILIAVPAAIATAVLALSSAIGYARLADKGWRDSVMFAAAAVVVPAYFIAIFAEFAPQYLEMFRRLVG
jgi:hypothetical protein